MTGGLSTAKWWSPLVAREKSPPLGLISDVSWRCLPSFGLRACPTLLVIDELGYLPLPAEGASALFQVIAQRYGKTSTIITTNRPIASWGDILGDATVAVIISTRFAGFGR